MEYKPNIGCKPAWLVAENRIKELAQAIYNSAIDHDTQMIKLWSKEIYLQAQILEKCQEELPF